MQFTSEHALQSGHIEQLGAELKPVKQEVQVLWVPVQALQLGRQGRHIDCVPDTDIKALD